MTYRSADPIGDESAALQELGALRSQLRTRVLQLSMLAGALLGVVGYLVTTQLQFMFLDEAWIFISALFGFFPPLAISGFVGLQIARRAARARTATWIQLCATKHGVKPEVLEDTVDLVADVEAKAEL
jgi:hypothetical protein